MVTPASLNGAGCAAAGLAASADANTRPANTVVFIRYLPVEPNFTVWLAMRCERYQPAGMWESVARWNFSTVPPSRMNAVFRHDGALEPGVGLVRIEQLCRRKPRGAKVRAAEAGIDQIGLEKIGSAQHRAGEVCGAHIGPDHVDALGGGAGQIGPQQCGSMQVRIGQRRAPQARIGEPRPPHIR